ncbi:MAG: hypothetical protein ISS47_05555 [Candidatus Omnitrophica bacterium]|nr:hypothetical protein [Candidatus Omnitrophota bacterium]
MQEAIPIGSIISATIWLFIVPIVLIIILRECKKRFKGEKKDSVRELENKLLKEITESYNKLTEEQKRKIDNIK